MIAQIGKWHTDGVQGLAETAVKQFGGIDIWINNAGLSYPSSSDITGVDPKKLEEIVATNLLGSMWGSRAAISQMKGQSSGIYVQLCLVSNNFC